MVTIKDVAEQAGVSIAAVSYALNDKEGVNEQTKKRILKIASEIGYVPNSMARGLATKRSDIIGIIAPDISNLYISTFIKYLEAYARENSVFLLIGSTGGKPEYEFKTIERIVSKNVDGIIITPINTSVEDDYTKIADYLNCRKIPYVLANLKFPTLDCSYVVPDLYNGEYTITKFLLEKGYKELIFVGKNDDNYYFKSRFDGFISALKEKGLEFSDKNNIPCGFDFEDGYHNVDMFLKDNPLPHAFVAINDMVAHGITKCLLEKGIDVPNDVAVVGFDNISVPTANSINLTTMEIPLKDMAKLCIDTIIEGKKKQYILKTKLILGNSTK